MYASAYVWAKIINYLEDRLSAVTVSATFDDTEVVEFTDSRLVLYSPSEFRRNNIRIRFASYIRDALLELFHSTAELVVFDEKMLEEFRGGPKRSAAAQYNAQFSFDNFVVGPSNRFAHGGAIAVANHPGQVYNPLFIYGPPGVGKTHLLRAIANQISANDPNAAIVNTNGEQFTNELVAAVRSGGNREFRSKYREADLFLIDDIQFIAGKEGIQEEFFNTFNTLYENRKQIVITSDRKPSDMLTLEERLQSRFESGLIADIQPPDYETRMAIIKTKAHSLGLELPDDVCNYIAVNVTSNVRQIEGTVNKILAYRNLNNMPLDLPNVSRAITDLFKSEGNTLPTPSLIISQVCKFYSVDESTLRGTQRTRGISEARQIAIYLIRQLTNLSQPAIAEEFGKDHTTILYSIKKTEAALKSGDTLLKKTIQDITANINSSL